MTFGGSFNPLHEACNDAHMSTGLRELIVGVGLAPGDISLDLGDFHPIAQGGFQLHLTLDGDTIVSAQPRIGFMHRGAEKLFEARDYKQIMMLANRHDWFSPFASELGVALTLETAMGITPPVRATWIRMLMAELTRVNAHLAFLVGTVIDSQSRDCRTFREKISVWFESATGNRVHPMFARIGGVAHDLDPELISAAGAIATEITSNLAPWRDSIDAADLASVAVLGRESALGHGASGPVGHASGLANDLRVASPYMLYSELEFLENTAPVDGDARSRFLQLAHELEQSAHLINQCVNTINGSPAVDVNVVLPKVVRAPEGTTYSWSEGPTGINGWLLVSAGDKTPWRLKLRSASFNNFDALTRTLAGLHIDQLPAAIKSTFIVIGDLDR